MPTLTETNRDHWGSAAASYSAYNATVIDRLGRELVSRLRWIGARFLDPDAAAAAADGDDVAVPVGPADGAAAGGEAPVRLLDYACGPGVLSKIFAPYVSSARGIDLSAAMAAEYNTAARNQGLTPWEMSASVGNLLDPATPSPPEFRGDDWFGFDIVVVGFAFHHFEDPVLAARRLAERLKTGGILLVVDFLPHGRGAGEGVDADGGHHGHGLGHDHGHFHDHGDVHDHGNIHDHRPVHGHGPVHDHEPFHDHEPVHEHRHDGVGITGDSDVSETVRHLGFSEDVIRDAFDAAGLGQYFSYQGVARGVVFATKGRRITRDVFFARGTKA